MCGTTENPDTHELVLERVLDAPREKVWRCWSEPDLLKRWFAPRPRAPRRISARAGARTQSGCPSPPQIGQAARDGHLHLDGQNLNP